MIHVIVGLMNSGKTLYMTYRLFLSYLDNRIILTNYLLNKKAIHHYTINQDWLFTIVKDNISIKDASFGLDELWLWLNDSRSSMGKEEKIGTYFFLQSSKDDSEIFITSQSLDQLDIRIQQNFHKLTECQRVLIIDGEIIPISEDKRFLNKKYGNWILDYLYIEAVTYNRELKNGMIILKKMETEYIPVLAVMQLYDTTIKISPMLKVFNKNG